ncbi:MAG: 30S ribosome-binding factor RbfA [Flavobacteriales bacterium]|jgi:ribosome-binding factor A|tara:strand:+ start:14176 stop:14535 length:360 start_codon:yes stop_codon:yes gene_type:complete
MESTRQKKVARQIQKDLAQILMTRTSSIAPGTIISVSLVRMSPDLSYAKVYLSVFPLKDKEAFLKAISIQGAEIRNELGKLVRHQLRIVPALSFYIDDSVDYAENIDRLLKGDDNNTAE